MTRILITGGSGLLALNWACRMRDSCEVLLAQHKHPIALARTRAITLDLESAAALQRGLEQLKPDLIVHTAGLTSVEACEQQPALAQHLNAELAKNVAAAAHGLNIRLVHISTDHLFAGTQSHYKEHDIPAPLNQYARTKLQAEQWVAEAYPAATIVRTNFFAWGHRYRQSLSDWILASLRKGEKITAFDDVFFTPILADRLADAVHSLVMQPRPGIFHIGGDERLSKHEFALRLAQAFDLPDTLISRDSISRSPSRVLRPRDMSLDNSKARQLLGTKLGGVDEFVRALREQEARGRPSELINSISESF